MEETTGIRVTTNDAAETQIIGGPAASAKPATQNSPAASAAKTAPEKPLEED
jgi:hypothetical protein